MQAPARQGPMPAGQRLMVQQTSDKSSVCCIDVDVAASEQLVPAGACNHALGYCREAVQDYQACFMTSDETLDAEARGQVYLGFYQKELALHMAANMDRPAAQLCVDRDIDPVFKVSLGLPSSPSPLVHVNGAGPAHGCQAETIAWPAAQLSVNPDINIVF